jgi:hypothetical protein
MKIGGIGRKKFEDGFWIVAIDVCLLLILSSTSIKSFPFSFSKAQIFNYTLPLPLYYKMPG